MTLDQDALDAEIIDVLRGDARSEVPPKLDQRVASRLAASAGIFGLSTAVTAGSQAAASATAATAVTTAASAAKLLTLGGLAKTLALGMALGSTVGLGLHVSFQQWGAPAVRPRPAAVVAARPLRAATPAPSPYAGSAVRPPSGDASAGVAGPLEPPHPSSPEPRTNPSPELPGERVVSAGVGLAAQQALLDAARAALRRGDGGAALAAIGRHTAEFPRTAFEEEREAVAIKALVLLGNLSEARARTEQFDARFQKSLLTPSLRAELRGPRKLADSVTDRGVSSQTTGEH